MHTLLSELNDEFYRWWVDKYQVKAFAAILGPPRVEIGPMQQNIYSLSWNYPLRVFTKFEVIWVISFPDNDRSEWEGHTGTWTVFLTLTPTPSDTPYLTTKNCYLVVSSFIHCRGLLPIFSISLGRLWRQQENRYFLFHRDGCGHRTNVEIIVAWHQNWKPREVYFRINKIHQWRCWWLISSPEVILTADAGTIST